MAPKDIVNIDWNYFYYHLIKMDNEHDDDEEINLTNGLHASSIDSFEQYDIIPTTASESLRFISGYHKWMNTNDKTTVDKINDYHHGNNNQIDFMVTNDDNNSIQQNTLSINDMDIILKNHSESEEEEEEDNEYSLSHMDISLDHFDVEHQINNDQLQQPIRNESFSSILSNISQTEKMNQNLETLEMDMENGDCNRKRTNGYSQHRNNNNDDESYKRNNHQMNGSSNNNNNGNGTNPNRNNNNSRRSDDGSEGNDGDDDNDDDDDDNNNDYDDNESDENIARRLGFLPINNETIRIINRLRNLTNKQTFDRRDFEILQTLIDELIHIQHLENSSKQQLKQIIRYLKLYRPLQTKSRALIFIQERIPRRAVKYNVISINNENHNNVFDIWRERERRARLDSKDSLEDDGQSSTGQQLRDVIEINHPTPPIILSTNSNTNSIVTSKVKQMARNIDTRTTTSRSELNIRTGDRFSDHAYIQRSSSPSYPGLVSVALYDIKSTNKNDGSYNGNCIEDRSRTKSHINQTNSLSPPSSSEPNRVRLLIDRLESSSTSSSSNIKTGKKIPIKKSLHDEHSDGSTSLTSSPPVKRFARRDYNEKNLINENNHNNEENFVFIQDDTHDEIFFSTNNNKNMSNEIKFEIDREDTANEDRRTISVTSMDEYVTTLLPRTETSVSMVRDIRAHVYEDVNALSRTDLDTIPIKVDVETLYILEEKSDKKTFQQPTVNIHIPDYEYNRPTTTTTTERQDFSVQTTIPIATIKPSHRPVGTQVESIIQQHTVAAQTTDSLHRPLKERQRLPSRTPSQEDDTKKITTTVTTQRYEIKRRHSSHNTSDDDDNDDAGAAVIFIDDESKLSNYEDNFELKREKRHSPMDDHLPKVPEQRPSFGQITSRIRIDQLRDINRHVVRRHLQDNDYNQDEYHSSEVYEIHTRGACKCIVVSYEEKTQYGIETRFEKQLQRIERTYTNDELKKIELHIIVTTSDKNYQLVKRDYNLIKQHNIIEKENNYEKSKQPSISIHYYTKDGQHMKTEHDRYLEHLPLVIRCEIEYELNHYGSSQLIILSVTHNERRQMNKFLKEELVDEIVSRSGGRLPTNSPQLEKEITRQLAEPINLLHLVDYSSRDDYNQTNSTDLRRVSRIDVTTSLRIVQRYRTIIHRFCQLYRTNLPLTQQIQQQRYLILVARDEYYLLDLSSPTSTITTNVSDIRQRQHDIFKREVSNVIQQQQKQQQHQPFDYAKYRRDIEQQQRFLEQHQRKQNEQKEKYQQTFRVPPPPGHPSEAEFYLGSERRTLIEREIHSMRESIRPHEHAPPRYKHEPKRRSLSISYSGGQRYIRARIIHIKDFYDDIQQRQQQQQQQQPKTKEQELFVRIDDYINESVANSLRRSYSTDYLQEDGPRSRICYIRIPGETIKIEEKTTYEYKGVMYADLPYSLRYWNILYILDREARQGRPLGSTLPHTIVNDPYRQVIPPLTQHEIRQTAQQILSPQYNGKTYTDQTLRWFLSRDNRTEIESAKYLQTLDQYRAQQQQQHKKSNVSLHSNEQQGTTNTYYTTEKLIRYEKMPDRLIPITTHDRAQSMQNVHHRSPSTPHILKPPNLPQNYIPRSQSQSQSHYQSSIFSHGSNCQTPSQQQQQRIQLHSMHSPLSRHQSVHELHASSPFSHPPSPSPSFHSLHSNQHHYINRRPVSYNTRFPLPQQQQQQQNAVLTEIIDSQTGRHFLTTSQEQLPTEVLGLLNKYNLQKF
ncbi:unnamed protein product [Rotaria sordida]|uniref:Uncharacterized protein n=1 Tax=Rotaria sordida TaxID=392033 RepID=A0A818MBK3_9BILA|nr:unnamed protein product [Rotaria sordida]CAF3588493.1 unnamed protein product [Rotaria sordida]